MEHLLAKTILITKVTEIIASERKLTLKTARDKLYNSNLIDLIEDDETGLYGESPLYVAPSVDFDWPIFSQFKKIFN